ncbi:glycerol kinase 1 isoform X2 [Rhodnius prolixus]|uniref:glycerol kinase 1 isoform X2 n=1 Tax=Rhodnius prolixus TaxID=13249 RepID=UPI003D18BC7D
MAMQHVQGTLIGSIDEGTSSARFLVFSSQTGRLVASHQIPISKHCAQEGWVEQDPVAIMDAVRQCLDKGATILNDKDIDVSRIAAIGISNQRETTILWDRTTGLPLHNAIVWLDMRTATTLESLLDKIPNRDKNYLKPICGLPLSPYFSALKIKWLMDNIPEVRQAIENKTCLFGTMDTWLMWNLTGGTKGGVHVTDVTNASRTMLMSLNTLDWDISLCKFFDIPREILPRIHSSSEIYGRIVGGAMDGIPIAGCLGDQHAALLGQKCFNKGMAKCTYGTGCFLLYNTGSERVESSHGLVTTVAYQLGKDAPPYYALEGSIAVAGAAFAWLKDNIGLVEDVKEIETLANRVHHSGDVYFVPAFSGLYAPYWQSDARGVICGITEETTKSHILRAALEAICFQTRDILESMDKDCGLPLSKIQVDGGAIQNNLLMQLKADLCGIPAYCYNKRVQKHTQ